MKLLTLIDWDRGKQYVLWTQFTKVLVNKYFIIIIYQESKKRNEKANFIRKYMKYFNNFPKKVKFNSVHDVFYKTFAVFGCPKVACSRDGARDFFVSERWIMHYLPCRWCEWNSLISSISRDMLSNANETHEKENFGDWYIIIKLVLVYLYYHQVLTLVAW